MKLYLILKNRTRFCLILFLIYKEDGQFDNVLFDMQRCINYELASSSSNISLL